MSQNSKLIDISPMISDEIAVFPGDVTFKRDVSLSFSEGNNIELSSITTTLHLGAHADAPSHYNKEGIDISSRDLDLYYGPCQVIEVKIEAGCRINLGDFDIKSVTEPRVLFKTNSFINYNKWSEGFNSLSVEVIRELAKLNVKLIGIDTPSIDPHDSKDLEAHSEVFNNDFAVLEGLVLKDVAQGVYKLMAFPLKINGAEAAPVRAVLEKL